MKIRALLVSLILCGAGIASAQRVDPVTDAVLKGYGELLAQNPHDFETLYQRGAQYYMMSQYDKALTDLDAALKYTPAKEINMRIGIYSLISDIYRERGEYPKALEAIDKALDLQGADYLMLYKKGIVCLKMKKAEEALNAFSRMRAMKARSQEAFFGMAAAQLQMGHLSEADELIKEGESLATADYRTYLQLGNLYADAGYVHEATINYIKAFTMKGDAAEPVQKLVELADNDFAGVESGFNSVFSRDKQSPALYYLFGRIAIAGRHYKVAYDCYSSMMQKNDSGDPALLAGAAEAAYYCNKLDEALIYINNAIVKEERWNYYVVKSKIAAGLNQIASALSAARQAETLHPGDLEVTKQLAISYMLDNKGDAAEKLFTEMIMSNPQDVELVMLRAYCEFELLNNSKGSIADYNRVMKMEVEGIRNYSYKAIATFLSSKRDEANRMMEDAMKVDENKTPEGYYYAAVYYGQTGNLERSKEMLDKAMAAGYDNLYNIYTNRLANLSIAPVRHLLK